MSEIKVNSVVNSTGDNDSGLDLSTNDQVIIKTANTTALTVDSSQNVTLASKLATTNLGTGAVLQVVQQVLSTEKQINSASYITTGLSKAITPTSTSSKILVIVNASFDVFQNGDAGRAIFAEIKRGSTQIAEKTVDAYADQTGIGYYAIPADGSMIFLDSPSTTSATTYTVNGKVSDASNEMTLRISKSSSDSTLTLMEIAGW